MEQGGALLCTTHMPSYPHATLACIAEKRHLRNQTHELQRRNHTTGGKNVAGRHNPREKGRLAMYQGGALLCTMHMPSDAHATLACIAENAICPTKLTGCDEGRMTQDGITWRGDTTHKRNGMSPNAQDRAVLCNIPMPQPLTQPSHAPPTKALATPSSPPAAKEA